MQSFLTTKVSYSKSSSIFIFWTIVYSITSLQGHLKYLCCVLLGETKVYVWFKQLNSSPVEGSEYIQSRYYHCWWLSGKRDLESDRCYMDLFVWWVKLGCTVRLDTVYPKKYAHGFVVLCFVVVMQSFIMNSHEVFIHIHQGCFAGTWAIVRLPQCQWSKPDGYGKISQ